MARSFLTHIIYKILALEFGLRGTGSDRPGILSRIAHRFPRLADLLLMLIGSRISERLIFIPIWILASPLFFPRSGDLIAFADRQISRRRGPGQARTSAAQFLPLATFFSERTITDRARMILRFVYYPWLRTLYRGIAHTLAARDGEETIVLSSVAFTISSRCNLNCRGCLSPREKPEDLDPEKLDYLLDQLEAQQAAYAVILCGGEPLLKNQDTDTILSSASRHPRINFLIFTNGTNIDRDVAHRIKRAGNILTLVSIDGTRSVHDARRGNGVFDRVVAALHALRAEHLPFGFSATVYDENHLDVTSEEFVREMHRLGNLFGLYIQHIPLNIEPEVPLSFGEDSREAYLRRFELIQARSPIPLIEMKTFEEKRYVCRSKKGNLIHINAVTGWVSPCPVMPYSAKTCNIYSRRHSGRLAEILRDPFFRVYRQNYFPSSCCHTHLITELSELAGNPHLDSSDREHIFLRQQWLMTPKNQWSPKNIPAP